jgi:hypothetical protein
MLNQLSSLKQHTLEDHRSKSSRSIYTIIEDKAVVVVDRSTYVFKVKLFYDEDGESKFLGTFCSQTPDSTVPYPLKQFAVFHVGVNTSSYPGIMCLWKTYAILGILSSRLLSKSRL